MSLVTSVLAFAFASAVSVAGDYPCFYARPLIERMTAQNVGRLTAIVVSDRTASMLMIWKAYSDNKLLIGVSNESDAERIVAVLNASPSRGSK